MLDYTSRLRLCLMNIIGIRLWTQLRSCPEGVFVYCFSHLRFRYCKVPFRCKSRHQSRASQDTDIGFGAWLDGAWLAYLLHVGAII